jgi:hypothetical protein
MIFDFLIGVIIGVCLAMALREYIHLQIINREIDKLRREEKRLFSEIRHTFDNELKKALKNSRTK